MLRSARFPAVVLCLFTLCLFAGDAVRAVEPRTADFTLTASPASVMLFPGSPSTTVVTVVPVGGFSGSVSLTISDLPSGVSASFSRTSTSSTSILTLSTYAWTFAGTSTITVTGNSAGLIRSTSVTLTAAPVLKHIEINPHQVNVLPNQSLQFSAVGYDQYGQPMSPQPAFTWSFESGSATNCSIDQSGQFKAGSVLETGEVRVVSTPITSQPPVSQSAVANVSANSLSVSTLHQSYPVNLTAQGASDWVLWGLNGVKDVNHKASGDGRISSLAYFYGETRRASTIDGASFSWTDGAPTSSTTATAAGLTFTDDSGCSFSVPADTVSRTLYVYLTGSSTDPGVCSAQLTDGGSDPVSIAVSGDVQIKFTYRAASSGHKLIVNLHSYSSPITLRAAALSVDGRAPDFSLGIEQATTTVARGAAAANGILLIPMDGFASPATLSLSGLPAGVTASFAANPMTSITTITFNAVTSAPVGDYPITVMAVNGSLSHTATFKLKVVAPDPLQHPDSLDFTPGDRQVWLFWPAVKGATSYQIYRGLYGEPMQLIATTTATSFTDGGLSNGLTYVFRIDTVGAAGASGAKAYVTPSMEIYKAEDDPSPGFVDLTKVGTADWAQWGSGGSGRFNHKASGGSLISDILGSQVGYDLGHVAYRWSDGLPLPMTTGSAAGRISGTAFSITAPADWTIRTLRVYVGGLFTNGTLITHISDWPTGAEFSRDVDWSELFDHVFTITYRAQHPGQTLQVTWRNKGFGLVTFQAAALAIGSQPEDFSIVPPSPEDIVVNKRSRNPATMRLTIKPRGLFHRPVEIGISGMPPGMTAIFSRNPWPYDTDVSIRVAPTVPNGTYHVTATGVAGPLIRSAMFDVIVRGQADPETPSGVTAVAGNGKVTLTWTPSVDVRSYSVWRATAAVGPYESLYFNRNETTFTDRGVTNGVTYYYAVSARNYEGVSTNSPPVASTPSGVSVAEDFGISSRPSSWSVMRGSNGLAGVILSSFNGFEAPVSLTISGVPSGVTAQFTANPVDKFSILLLMVDASASVGKSIITITGTSGSMTHTLNIPLTILAPSVVDLNGDSRSDLILQNSSTNQVALWYMNNTAMLTGQYLTVVPAAGWAVAASGPFNFDGNPDLILQEAVTRRIGLWRLSGVAVTDGVFASAVPGANLKVRAAGDFNNDGRSDIVLQDTFTSQISIWLMNDAIRTAVQTVTAIPGVGWSVVGAADMSGDGKTDLVLQNAATNKIAIWVMNGAALSAGMYVSSTPGAGYKVVGVADYNGDGKRDLVLQDSATNKIALWYLNGATLLGGAYVSPTPPVAWKVVGPR
jgi:hypothetical protein